MKLRQSDVKETRLEREFRAAGGRLTPQRRLIASILQEQGRHLSAEEIYLLARRQHPRLSLATVYRMLRRLKESGLVRELQLAGNCHHYEIKRGEGHQHMVCLGCGRVIEFTCNHCKEVHSDLADQYGFEITGARVKLSGYCTDCQVRVQRNTTRHGLSKPEGDSQDENRRHN
jgi:Fe2+ or Zn2+ uptake regulation protein